MITKILRWLHNSFVSYFSPSSIILAQASTVFFCFLSMWYSFGVSQTVHMLTEMVPLKFFITFSIFAFLSSIILYAIWNWAAKSHVVEGRSRSLVVSAAVILTVLLTSCVKLTSQVVFALWFSAGRNWFEGADFSLVPDLLWNWKKQLLIVPTGLIKISASGHDIYPVNWTYIVDPFLIVAVVAIFINFRFSARHR